MASSTSSRAPCSASDSRTARHEASENWAAFSRSAGVDISTVTKGPGRSNRVARSSTGTFTWGIGMDVSTPGSFPPPAGRIGRASVLAGVAVVGAQEGEQGVERSGDDDPAGQRAHQHDRPVEMPEAGLADAGE